MLEKSLNEAVAGGARNRWIRYFPCTDESFRQSGRRIPDRL